MFKLKIRNTLFTRLLLLFVLTIVCIQMFSLLIFSAMRASLQYEIQRHSESVTSFLETQIENVVDNAWSKCVTLCSDDTNFSIRYFFNYGTTLNESDYWIAVRSIISDMRNINSTNEIEDIIVYYPTLNLSISQLYGLQSLMDNESTELLNAYYTQDTNTTWFDESLNVCYLFPRMSTDTAEIPKIIIRAKISLSELRRISHAYAVTEESIVVLLKCSTNEIIMKTNSVSDALLWDIQNQKKTSSDKQYAILYDNSVNSDFLIVQCVSYKQFFQNADRFSNFFYIFLLLSIPLCLIIIHTTYRLIKQPIDALLHATKQIQNGEITDISVSVPTSQEFEQLIISFNDMSAKLSETIDQLYRQKVHTRESEFKQLQSQINPHFLYNSFYILRHQLQEKDWESAENLTGHLAEYFLYITRTGRQEIPLSEEWKHCHNYLAIQETRFGFSLSIHQQKLTDEVGQIIVPRLILQPLLENALNHGIKNQLGGAHVALGYQVKSDTLQIYVEDSGSALTADTLKQMQQMLLTPEVETTALTNIHRRIVLKYGSDYGLSFGRSLFGGLLVKLEIPITYGGVK